jgi:CBS domain containing-hemolysin-like protein
VIGHSLVLLFVFVGFALTVSFLCSLLEATLLSVRLGTLSEQRAAGSRGAGLLLDLKRNRVGDAISAILILNTISNTLGATLAGAQAARVFGSSWIGLFSGVLTLLILVVSEIIPKTLGAVYATSLASLVGWTLLFLTRLMAPALVISRAMTRLLTRGEKSVFSRGELAAVIETAARDGTLSADESALLANLLRVKEVQVEDVMTPRTVTFMMPVTATVRDLLAEPETEAFSRIPLYREDPDNVVGYVLQRDVMKAAANGCDRERPLESFLREIWFVPELTSVGQALQQFLERREPIAMVTDEHGALAGLVTLEDLTETMLGTEIVDEFDQIVDLRQKALDLRDRRLQRLRQKRELASGASSDD